MGTRFRGLARIPMSVLAAAAAAAMVGLSASDRRRPGRGSGIRGPPPAGHGPSRHQRHLAGVHHRQLETCRTTAPRPGRSRGCSGCGGAQPPGQGVVLGNEIPYRPEALARKRENLERRLAVDHDNINTVGDPEAKCYLPGVPRATYMPFPFQIIQSTGKIIIAYQFASASRTIPLDGTSEAPVDSWMGWSNGRWEGDTLVVEVNGFNDLSWFDRPGTTTARRCGW